MAYASIAEMKNLCLILVLEKFSVQITGHHIKYIQIISICSTCKSISNLNSQKNAVLFRISESQKQTTMHYPTMLLGLITDCTKNTVTDDCESWTAALLELLVAYLKHQQWTHSNNVLTY